MKRVGAYGNDVVLVKESNSYYERYSSYLNKEIENTTHKMKHTKESAAEVTKIVDNLVTEDCYSRARGFKTVSFIRLTLTGQVMKYMKQYLVAMKHIIFIIIFLPLYNI